MLGNVGSGGTGKVSGIAVMVGRGGVRSLVTDALFDGSRAELWVRSSGDLDRLYEGRLRTRGDNDLWWCLPK